MSGRVSAKAPLVSVAAGGATRTKCAQCYCTNSSPTATATTTQTTITQDPSRRSSGRVSSEYPATKSSSHCRACSQCSCKLRSSINELADKPSERCVILRKNNSVSSNKSAMLAASATSTAAAAAADDAASDSGACSDESIKIVIMGSTGAPGGTNQAAGKSMCSASKLCDRYKSAELRVLSSSGSMKSVPMCQHGCKSHPIEATFQLIEQVSAAPSKCLCKGRSTRAGSLPIGSMRSSAAAAAAAAQMEAAQQVHQQQRCQTVRVRHQHNSDTASRANCCRLHGCRAADAQQSSDGSSVQTGDQFDWRTKLADTCVSHKQSDDMRQKISMFGCKKSSVVSSTSGAKVCCNHRRQYGSSAFRCSAAEDEQDGCDEEDLDEEVDEEDEHRHEVGDEDEVGDEEECSDEDNGANRFNRNECLAHKVAHDCNNSSGSRNSVELSRSASRCSLLSSRSSNSTSSSSFSGRMSSGNNNETAPGFRFCTKASGKLIIEDDESSLGSPQANSHKHIQVDENNNNNSLDCVDLNEEYRKKHQSGAISETRLAPVSQAPPPPPPPPPPPMVGLAVLGANTPTSMSSSNAASMDASADLRQAIAQHRSRASNDTLSSSSSSSSSTDYPKNRSATKPMDASRSVSSKLGTSSTALAAFIPPQFVRPPENGANIKPSEYLKRISATTTETPTPTTTESARLIYENKAKSDENSSNDSSSDTTTTPVFKQQQQQPRQSNNRFRQMAALRNPLGGELHRSQSTSALNRFCGEENHSQSDGDETNFLNDERTTKDSDSVVSGCSSGSSSGPNANTKRQTGEDCSILPSLKDFGGGDNPRSQSSDKSSTVSESCGNSSLMNALRNFDRSKYLKSVNKAHSVINEPISRNTSGSVNKLDSMLDATKRDLIAELKETKNLDGIKRMKESYRFKGDQLSPLLALKMPEFKAEDYMDKVTQIEPEAPLWRRQMLAKKAAERARKEHEEKVRLEIEERRHNQVPAWKRQMLAKKTADRRRRNSELEANLQITRNGTGKSMGEDMDEIRCFGNDSSDGLPAWRRQVARVKNMTASTDNVNIISNFK